MKNTQNNQNCHFSVYIVSIPQKTTFHTPSKIIESHYTLKGFLYDEKIYRSRRPDIVFECHTRGSIFNSAIAIKNNILTLFLPTK